MALKGALANNIDNKEHTFGNTVNCDRSESDKEENICPICGILLLPGSKFCSSCGTPLFSEAHKNESAKKGSVHKVEQPDDNTNDSIYNRTVYPEDNPISGESSSQTENTIAAARKRLGIITIILGLIIAGGGGAAASWLSKQYEPSNIQYGYRDPNTGEYIVTDTGTIGGNYEAVSYYNSAKVFLIIAGIAVFCIGVRFFSSGREYEETKSIKKHGKVVGIDMFGASIEFDDGSRSRIPYLTKLVLVIGDIGIFEIKENTIIGFEKR